MITIITPQWIFLSLCTLHTLPADEISIITLGQCVHLTYNIILDPYVHLSYNIKPEHLTYNIIPEHLAYNIIPEHLTYNNTRTFNI